jgi:WD40 repeat protein
VLVSSGWWAVLAWDLASGKRSTLAGRGLWGAALRPDGTLLATGDERGVGLWDLEPRDALRLRPHAGRVVATFSPDGRMLATGDEDGVVRTFDASSGRLEGEHRVHAARIRALDFAPDGAALLAGSGSGELVVLDPASGEVALRLEDHSDMSVAAAAFGPEGRRLAHTAPMTHVHVHDARSGELVGDWAASAAQVLAVAWSHDGRIATTARDDRVCVWSSEGELQLELSAPKGPWRPAFSDDGTRLAVSAWAPAIYVYDLADGSLEATLTGHRAVVWDVAFAPGSVDTLASASDDGTIKLWDVANERCLVTLDDFEGWDAFTVSFGRPGFLAAGGRRSAVIRDLEYYDRHIAANAAARLEHQGLDLDPQRRRVLAEWVEQVFRRPWPRLGPAANER